MPKSLLVERRRACANNYPVHSVLENIFLDLGLAGVRAHRHVGTGYNHIGQLPQSFGNLFAVDDITDVATAITGIGAYANFLSFRRGLRFG
jgi:hypothetical protein